MLAFRKLYHAENSSTHTHTHTNVGQLAGNVYEYSWDHVLYNSGELAEKVKVKISMNSIVQTTCPFWTSTAIPNVNKWKGIRLVSQSFQSNFYNF